MKKSPGKAKKPGKRTKVKKNEALRAFILSGVLVVVSIIVSAAVITIHSKSKKIQEEAVPETSVTEDSHAQRPVAAEPDPLPQTQPQTSTVNVSPVPEPPKPVSSAAVPPASRPQTEPSKNTGAVKSTAASNVKPSQELGSLVFVIDDAGNNLRELEPFLAVPGPLTIAVLPGLPHSAEAARRIRAAGKEVFLHQPMEAIGAQNPGPGAIYSGMSAEEVRSILKRNLAEVGPVTGINNHQGSKITMDSVLMETILDFCSEQGINFLDSRTTSETVVPSVARRMGMKVGERDIFLDNEQGRDSMKSYINSGLTRAQKNGSAVMIGHAWSPALAPLLSELYPQFIRQGYTIKTASDIIKLK